MALFKPRKSGDEPANAPKAPESLEGMRLRATFRLIGAAVLVVAAILGFPLVFDSQPRPIPVSVSIEIPDKAKAPALSVEKAASVDTSAANTRGGDLIDKPAQPVAIGVSKVPQSEPDKAEIAKPESSVESKPPPKVVQKPEPKPEIVPASKAGEAEKVMALLEGKDKGTTGAERFVVQVGAFADSGRAREARSKVESAGLKTYTQVVDTKDGQRTRVRVGPFSDKGEAEKVAAKLKAMGLGVSILSL